MHIVCMCTPFQLLDFVPLLLHFTSCRRSLIAPSAPRACSTAVVAARFRHILPLRSAPSQQALTRQPESLTAKLMNQSLRTLNHNQQHRSERTPLFSCQQPSHRTPRPLFLEPIKTNKSNKI